MNTNLFANYTLINDIDCSNTTSWNLLFEPDYFAGFTPIGQGEDNPFSGSLNGQGHTIYDLYINRLLGFEMENVPTALFSTISHSNITNVHLEDVIIISGLGITSTLAGLAHYSNIVNCSSTNSSLYISDETTVNVGDGVGGMAGNIHSSNISNSFFEGSIQAGYSYVIGGMVGVVISSFVDNSYSLGEIYGHNTLGGFIGETFDSKINNSYSSVSLTLQDPDDPNIEGGSMGGFISSSSSIITASYYDSNISNQSDIGKGEPKTTEQLKELSTFTGWSILPTANDINNGYPYLAWQAD
jgi:hypothetical protein